MFLPELAGKLSNSSSSSSLFLVLFFPTGGRFGGERPSSGFRLFFLLPPFSSPTFIRGVEMHEREEKEPLSLFLLFAIPLYFFRHFFFISSRLRVGRWLHRLVQAWRKKKLFRACVAAADDDDENLNGKKEEGEKISLTCSRQKQTDLNEMDFFPTHGERNAQLTLSRNEPKPSHFLSFPFLFGAGGRVEKATDFREGENKKSGRNLNKQHSPKTHLFIKVSSDGGKSRGTQKWTGRKNRHLLFYAPPLWESEFFFACLNSHAKSAVIFGVQQSRRSLCGSQMSPGKKIIPLSSPSSLSPPPSLSSPRFPPSPGKTFLRTYVYVGSEIFLLPFSFASLFGWDARVRFFSRVFFFFSE